MLVLAWQQGLTLCGGTYVLMYIVLLNASGLWSWIATATVDLIFERPTYQ